MGNKIVIGCWDCTYCGTDRISGELRDCPNCGHPRDKDIKFYLADPKNYAADQDNVSKNPDWLCPFCDSLNPDSATICSSCGAARDAKTQNYFQNREKQEAQARKQQTLAEEMKHAIQDMNRTFSYSFGQAEENLERTAEAAEMIQETVEIMQKSRARR